jgi:CRISPR/Cas system CSM-associated protein Csm3 (group 7 of RAMP superfamily)
MTTNKPYRTLFVGTLVQDSALSTGGIDTLSGVDDPLCRNGEDRFTLRGTTLAGALIATARTLYPKIPPEICVDETNKPDKPSLTPSVWRVYTSHPENNFYVEVRQGVGIHAQTGAAMDEALFDLETLPPDTRWPFLLEVDNWRANKLGVPAEQIAAAALLEWQRHRCWIGRSVARGLGWLHLENLKAYYLNTEHVTLWPNSFQPLKDVLKEIENKAIENKENENKVTVIEATQFSQHFNLQGDNFHPKKRYYIEIQGHIHVGERDNGYGLDALSVSGHAANLGLSSWDGEHYLSPEGKSLQHCKNDFNPDNSIVMTCRNERYEPFIPGSSLRGVLRHALSRHLRRKGKNIHAPSDGIPEEIPKDIVAQLFGSFSKSISKKKAKGAALLIRDAYLVKNGNWKAAWLQHHAEDEFSGGVYGTGKFDRVALLQAQFSLRMVIEAKTPRQAHLYYQRLKPILELGEQSHLPLGGNQWRGLGWVKWQVDQVSESWAGEFLMKREYHANAEKTER